MRAIAYSRGLTLPPRGSAQDEILREVLYRERMERWTFAEKMFTLIGAGLGVPPKLLEQLTSEYHDELFQSRYTRLYRVKKKLQRKVAEDKVKSDIARLDKLNTFTDTTPAKPKASKSKRR